MEFKMIDQGGYEEPSSGDEPETFKSGGLNPNPSNQQSVQTKTIILPTWPIEVPAEVPVNTPEGPDNSHSQENEGAAEGLGGDEEAGGE
jgi:hypothetical protein